MTEAEKLAGQPCSKVEQERPPDVEERCRACNRAGRMEAPMFDPLTGIIEYHRLCESCYNDYLKLLRKGPEIRPRVYGRGGGYHFSPLNTWFEQMAGAWPCPACDEFYDTFADVVRHFAGKHIQLVERGLEPVEISVGGEKITAVRCWQGVYCPCGYLTDNERHLINHYRRGHQ